MKKTFELTDPKIKPARKVEAIKSQINKYIKRERKKELPSEFDFWDFDCAIGDSAESKKEIHVTEISKYIDQAVESRSESIYIEVLSSPRKRTTKSESSEGEIHEEISESRKE